MGDPLGMLSVIITRDGGATWSAVSCEDLPPAEEAAFAASNGTSHCSGMRCGLLQAGWLHGFLLAGSGRTWEVSRRPLCREGMTGMFSVARCDEANGMGWGGNWESMDDNAANKIATADGGETWELLDARHRRATGRACSTCRTPTANPFGPWALNQPFKRWRFIGPPRPTVIFTRYGSPQTAKPPGSRGAARLPAVRSNTDHFTTTVCPGWLLTPMTT